MCALTVLPDGTIRIDWDGTSPMSPRGINVPVTYTRAYSSFGVRCIVGSEVPNNAGSLAAIEVSAPPGSLLNAPPPAAVSARHSIGQMLPDVVLGCLEQALEPGAVPAEGASCLWNPVIMAGPGLTGGHAYGGEEFVVNPFHAGGTGARPGKDGLSATAFPSGVRSTPIEITETVAPLIFWRKEYPPRFRRPGRVPGRPRPGDGDLPRGRRSVRRLEDVRAGAQPGPGTRRRRRRGRGAGPRAGRGRLPAQGSGGRPPRPAHRTRDPGGRRPRRPGTASAPIGYAKMSSTAISPPTRRPVTGRLHGDLMVDRTRSRWTLACIAAAVAACGDGSTDPGPGPEPARTPVATVSALAGEVSEGLDAIVSVRLDPPPASPIIVRYTLSADGDPATADADTADYRADGSAPVPAGTSVAEVRIAILDDDDIEPAREAFLFTLDPPATGAGYEVGATASTQVTIAEGVCDRTPEIRDALVVRSRADRCSGVTTEHLGITTLNLGRHRDPHPQAGRPFGPVQPPKPGPLRRRLHRLSGRAYSPISRASRRCACGTTASRRCRPTRSRGSRA